MSPSPVKVIPLDDYKLQITFKNGEIKVFDCSYLLENKYYCFLKDASIFKSVKISGHTIEWANGIDICPDELYENSVNICNGG